MGIFRSSVSRSLLRGHIEVSTPTLIEEKHKKGKSLKDFVEKFKNLSFRCPKSMPLSMLLQICRHNLHENIETNIDIVHVHIWKELYEQAGIIEKSISKLLVDDKGKQQIESATMCSPPSKFKEKNVLVIDTSTKPKKVLLPRQRTILSQRA